MHEPNRHCAQRDESVTVMVRVQAEAKALRSSLVGYSHIHIAGLRSLFCRLQDQNRRYRKSECQMLSSSVCAAEWKHVHCTAWT